MQILYCLSLQGSPVYRELFPNLLHHMDGLSPLLGATTLRTRKKNINASKILTERQMYIQFQVLTCINSFNPYKSIPNLEMGKLRHKEIK